MNRRMVLFCALGVVQVADAQQLPPFKGFAPSENTLTEAQKRKTLNALRKGGHVIFFRHARTDWSTTDTDRDNLENCATQRNLSAEGRAQARAIGASLRALGVQIGEVFTSPYCRTLETAKLAFGRGKAMETLRHLFPEDEANHRTVGTRLYNAFAEAAASGRNTVMVSHGFNFRAVYGFDPNEGEAAVVKPNARGGHVYVGRLTSEDLDAFARQVHARKQMRTLN
jgi:broad specificity phosphatase PhoE